MTVKLTLTLNDEVFKRATTYAEQRGTSVSEVVETYLEHLVAENAEVSGIVAELAGVLKDVDTDALRDGYTEHLDRKHR